jgi:hypothetical protein
MISSETKPRSAVTLCRALDGFIRQNLDQHRRLRAARICQMIRDRAGNCPAQLRESTRLQARASFGGYKTSSG